MAPTKKHTAEDLGVTEDFEPQPREPDFEGLDTDSVDELNEEAHAAGLPFAPALEFQPSSRNNPYVTEEMQGMEMTPQVIGPPPYGSPDPNTSSGRLVAIQDHPLAPGNLPEDHPSAISSDYAFDLLGDASDVEIDAMGGRQAREEFQQAQGDVDATDSARDLAESNNVDLRNVTGTGKDGKVTKGDVENYIDEREGEDNDSANDEA